MSLSDTLKNTDLSKSFQIELTNKDGSKQSYSYSEAKDKGIISNGVDAGLLNNTPVYSTADGKFTTDASTLPASVSLDEKTGKITVKAPSIVLGNETFKSQLDSTLKALSANYKLNPDYKYSYTDEDGTTKEKDIKKIIEELNAPAKNEDGTYNTDSINYLVNAAKSIENAKTAHKKNADLTDEDVIKLMTVAIGENTKDTSLQLISDLSQADFFRNLETYDPETGTAQYKDIMENAWNKEKVSGEDMIALIAALEDYYKKGDFSDKDQYIKNTAMLQFIESTQPEMSWWRDVGENIVGFLNGIGSFATNLITGLGTAVDKGVFQNIANLNGEENNHYLADYSGTYIKKGGWEGSDTPYELVDAKIGTVEFDKDGVPTFTEKEIEGSIENPQTFLEYLRAVYKENQAVQEHYTEMLHGSQSGWTAFGYGLTSLASLISAGNVLGAAAKSGTASVISKLAEVARGGTAENVSAIAKGLGTIYKVAQATGQGAKFVKVVLNITQKAAPVVASVVGESFAEAIVGDPDRLVDVLNSGDLSTDDKTYLMETFVGNAIGYGVGAVVVKGLIKAGETTKGRVISANIRNSLYKIQNNVGDAFDSLILKVRRIGGDDLAEQIENLRSKGGRAAKQANALAATQEIRKAREAIYSSGKIKMAGKTAEEIEEALAKVDEKVVELLTMENALNNMTRRGVDIATLWVSDNGSTLKAATKGFYDAASEVAKAEKTAGKAFSKVSGSVSDVSSGKPIQLFSQTTTDYIKAQEKLAFIRNYQKFYEDAEKTQDVLSKLSAYEKETVELEGMIKTFTDSSTPELLAAANNFIEKDKKWWFAFEDLRARLGLTSQDELDAFRKSGLWGTKGADYAQTGRRKDLSEYTIQHRDGSSNVKQFDSYDQYMAGASGSFIDPMAQMQIALYESANKYAYRQFIKSYNNLTGSLTTKVSGKESALVNKMEKGLKKAYVGNSKYLLSTITENIAADDTIGSVIRNLKTKVSTKIGQNTAAKRIREAAKKAAKNIDAVDSTSVSRFVGRMDDDAIEALWKHYYGENTDLLDEGFLEGAKTLIDRQYKKAVELSQATDLPKNPTLAQKYIYANAAAEYAGDTGFSTKVKRTILKNSSVVQNDTKLQKYLTEANEQARKLKYDTTLKDLQDQYEEFSRQYNIAVDELNYIGGQQTIDYVNMMLEPGTSQRAAIDEMLKYYELEGSEDAARYFALSAFMDNKTEYRDELRDQILEIVKSDHPTMPGNEQDKIADILTNGITRTMEEEYTELYHIVKEMNPDAVHETTEKMLDEVAALSKKIEGAKADVYSGKKNIIAMRNNAGELEYYETDPLLAGLVNFQASSRQMSSWGKAIYNTNYLWSKLFRLGTTAINIKSMVAQTFRDPINMWVGTGAYKRSDRVAKELTEVFGDDVVNYLKTYEPEAFKTLSKTAEETGQDVAKLAVERELGLGKALSPTSTETYMYSTLKTARKARIEGAEAIYDRTVMDKVVEGIDEVGNKLGKANEIRERTLRNMSYSNGLQTALKRGYSLDQARAYATSMMNEGTTNFTRMTNHLTALRDTVPYLGSAINGSKSFWRLLSLDPVGVMGRLTGGIIIPTVALTAYSLMDEENREIYKNIPEYQKEDNIIFVACGQVFSIPIPQDFTAFISPWRQFVESMYGVSTNTFFELVANDIVGFSPIELSGFTNLDYSKLEMSSPGLLDRISTGTTKLWSQLAPAPLKSALELATGIDPYTGKEIDTSNTDIDENGNFIVKDYKSGLTAKALSTLFGSWGIESSAPVIQNVLGNIFGDASVDIADFVSSLIQSVANGGIDWSSDADALSKNEAYNPFYTLTQRLTSPMTVSAYDEAQSAWKAAVSKAFDMKKEILTGYKWEKYLTKKSQATDPAELEQLNTTRKELLEPYFNYVQNMVENLQANYGETLTPAKYSSVLSLMTMDRQTLDAGSYGKYLNTEEFKTARAQAIQTMINLGFPSATGKDILGKYKVNSSGDITVETYHPLAILQLDDTKGAALSTQSKKQHFAVIRTLVNDAGLYDEKANYRAKISEAYSKKDYDEAEALTNEYNEKLIKAVGTYIEQNTPESVLQGDALNYLRNYIIVPSSFQINKYGKYATALGNGAYKSEAFEEPYLKYIFNYGENKL